MKYLLILALALPIALQAQITVEVTPSPASVHPEDVIQFKVDIRDSMGKPVTKDVKTRWSVIPDYLGKMKRRPRGMFNASKDEGTGIIYAIVETPAGKGFASAEIEVNRETPMHGLKVKMLPPEGFLSMGKEAQFKIEVSDKNNKPVTKFKTSWSLMPPYMGKITKNGTFTPEGNGEVRITALVSADTVDGIGEITVPVGDPKNLLPVEITPTRAILDSGETTKFEYMITKFLSGNKDSASANPTTIWKVFPEGLGTITADGIFTAAKRKGIGGVILSVTAGELAGIGHARVILTKTTKDSVQDSTSVSKTKK